jgi:hypothetical protein
VEADSIEPERKMVNSDLLKMRARGETWSVAEPTESDLYWVPPERFLACYGESKTAVSRAIDQS